MNADSPERGQRESARSCLLLAIAFTVALSLARDTWPESLIVRALTWPLLASALSLMLVGLELFVAALQAFIFAVLSASYIGQAMAEGH